MTPVSELKDTSTTMSEMLRDLIASIEGDQITLRDLMAAIGEQGLLLLCALLSLPFLIPVSVPGISTAFGAAIMLIGLAVTTNRLPWLPSSLLNRKIETARLVPVLEKGANYVGRIDRLLRPRLHFLTDGAVINRLNGLTLTTAGLLLMLPLSIILFSNTLPAVAIILVAVGIIQRDGLIVLGGYMFLLLTAVYFAALTYIIVSAGKSLPLFSA